VSDDAASPGTTDTPALPAPGPDPRLEAARNMARENPIAMANIVRGWVSGEST
jgi:flagellar M-ring protein FliF